MVLQLAVGASEDAVDEGTTPRITLIPATSRPVDLGGPVSTVKIEAVVSLAADDSQTSTTTTATTAKSELLSESMLLLPLYLSLLPQLFLP